MRAKLQQLADRTGLRLQLDARVADLPVDELQRLEIRLYRGARPDLDEPTAVLTPQETDQLFVTLRALRDRGRR